MKKLVSVSEYEALVREKWDKLRLPKGTGVACPQCGGELQEQSAVESPMLGISQAQYPKKYVTCGTCKSLHLVSKTPGEL